MFWLYHEMQIHKINFNYTNQNSGYRKKVLYIIKKTAQRQCNDIVQSLRVTE